MGRKAPTLALSTNHTTVRLFAKLIITAVAAAFGTGIVRGENAARNDAGYGRSDIRPPPVRREFRAAWIATVYNLDWPSKPGLSPAAQRRELIRILDRAVELRLNAVILQVRPSSDALYNSRLEPWASWLSGTMGKPPDPFYDPLEFAVTEAHRRGLELHAWFNPFRALPNAKDGASAKHVSKTHPDWIIRYGNYLWLDPGNPNVHDHVVRVVMDVVRRYDIDGVHFDDYFYPYPKNSKSGGKLAFPDDSSWKAYVRGGGKMERSDWRRDNVTRFVRRIYAEIKQARPEVKFGISPFGIWRPRVPETIEAGIDAYGELNADSRLWLREGWLDYLSPQLYWSIQPAKQSFPVLLNWWAAQNVKQRHLWPGIATERVGSKRPAQEMVNQIELIRKVPGSDGHIHWSMKSLVTNLGGVANLLARTVYSEPALIPETPWLGAAPPGAPELKATTAANGVAFDWAPAAEGAVPGQWLVQLRVGGEWVTRILGGGTRNMTVRENVPEVFALTPVSRTGIAGRPVVISRTAK